MNCYRSTFRDLHCLPCPLSKTHHFVFCFFPLWVRKNQFVELVSFFWMLYFTLHHIDINLFELISQIPKKNVGKLQALKRSDKSTACRRRLTPCPLCNRLKDRPQPRGETVTVEHGLVQVRLRTLWCRHARVKETGTGIVGPKKREWLMFEGKCRYIIPAWILLWVPIKRNELVKHHYNHRFGSWLIGSKWCEGSKDLFTFWKK